MAVYKKLVALVPGRPDRRLCPDTRALHSVSRSMRGPRHPSDKREGHAAPSIQKDPAAASYGCIASARRDDEAESRSTFETSKYNSCNIRLKTVKTLETCF
jgi:hypothetical protein